MQFHYNGVDLDFVKVHSVDRRAVYTEDNADYLYDHVTLDISAIFNPAADSNAVGGGLSPVSLDRALRFALMEPRGVLIFRSLGVPLYEKDTNQPDANNGPAPIALSLTRLDGDRTWFVRYQTQFWVNECPDPPGALLSNRYSQSHEIDEQHMLTLKTAGRAVFRSDILDEYDQIADDFRHRILPPVARGMQRLRTNLTVAPNRNSIAWETIDREKMFDLGDTSPAVGGSGIVHANVMYGVQSITGEGGVAMPSALSHVEVELRGSRLASLWRMTQIAWQVAANFVPLADLNKGILHHINIRQVKTDRVVVLSAAVKIWPQAPANIISPFVTDSLRNDKVFPDVGGINPPLPNDFGTRGTLPLSLLSAALNDACQQVACAGWDVENNPGLALDGVLCSPVAGPEPQVTIQFGDALPPQTNYYDPSSYTNPYDDYRINTEYHKIYNNYYAPRTSAPSSPTGSSGGTGTGSGSPAPTVEVMHLAQPMAEKVVRFTATRVNQMPTVPLPTPKDPNLVLLESKVDPTSPALMPDGVSGAYRIDGLYRYVVQVPYAAGDVLALGKLPWVDFAGTGDFLQCTDYDDLLDGGGGGGAACDGSPTGTAADTGASPAASGETPAGGSSGTSTTPIGPAV